MGRPLRIVFAAPAYWPATAFGGPIPVMRALALELTTLGHRVDVVTTTLKAIGERPARSSRTDEVDGATIRYLGTPLRCRWFGLTPSLSRALGTLPRPDVVHVFGYRDCGEHGDGALVPPERRSRTCSSRSGCFGQSCARWR